MLTDGEANAQDSGKMQQEAFSLATILLSKLEKHPAPKQGKHTHMNGRAAAFPDADLCTGQQEPSTCEGGPGPGRHWNQKPAGCPEKQTGERTLRGHHGLAALPLGWSKGPGKHQPVPHDKIFIKHLLCPPMGETKSGARQGVLRRASQPNTLFSRNS